MWIYNQKLQKETVVACSIYSMLNIMKYDYFVDVYIKNILWIVKLMQKIGALMPTGAYFNIIYPAFVKLIEFKTWLKFKVEKGYISKWVDKRYTRWVGLLKANLDYKRLTKDGVLTAEEMDTINNSKFGSGHNNIIKWIPENKLWTVAESLWGFSYRVAFKNIQYGQSIWLYYDTVRTILPRDDRTKAIQKKLIKLAKRKKKAIHYSNLKELIKLYKSS